MPTGRASSGRARSQRMTTLPLDVDELLGELDARRRPVRRPARRHPHRPRALPGGRRAGGHPLLPRPARLRRWRRSVRRRPSSAGGYHHHVGANTWESRGRPPAPPGSATLRRATVVLPTAADRDAGRGPHRRRGVWTTRPATRSCSPSRKPRGLSARSRARPARPRPTPRAFTPTRASAGCRCSGRSAARAACAWRRSSSQVKSWPC